MLTKTDIQMLNFMREYGGLTINQAYMIFWKHAKYGRDLARKRLNQLFEWGQCKHSTPTNLITQERVYYIEKPISAHKFYLNNYYANLVFYGAEILDFPPTEMKFTGATPDGFVKYRYNGKTYISFLEVVIFKKLDYEKYEKLKDLGEVQEKYGAFPNIVVISENPNVYKSNKLSVKYIGCNMIDFHKLIL